MHCGAEVTESSTNKQHHPQDVDNLDNIQDGFIHYQLIRFCQEIRLQYLNGHVQLANQNVL